MQKLSLELLEQNILNEKDSDYVADVPVGLDPILFDEFLRVMQAKSPKDIADVSDDVLISMLDDGGKYFNVLTFENFFESCLFGRLCSEKSVSAKKRIL